jgi:hypothetical protein
MVALAPLACLLVSGCDKDDYGLIFSHAQHVTEFEMSCEDCHGPLGPEGFTTLSHASCSDCHDETEAEEISSTTCGLCHREKNPEELIAPAGAMSGAFVHTAGLEGRCNDCHGGIMEEELDRVPLLGRRDVLRLREDSHAQGMACTLCHVDMDPDVAPADHEQDWMRRHGLLGVLDDAACGACHAEDSCRECHSVMMPSDHNNLWRLKTHGVVSYWDRERCVLCHESDACDNCHQTVRPRSHHAGWNKTHCYQCHIDSAGGGGCAVCHQDGLADGHPNPHPAGYRSRHCDSCHPGTPEAEQCTLCHEGGFEAHPNPHSAGWTRRHCDSCHPDNPQSRECRLCHDTTVETHPNVHGPGWRDRHCFGCHQDASRNDCATCHPGGNSVLVHQGFWPPVHDRFGDQADCYVCHRP